MGKNNKGWQMPGRETDASRYHGPPETQQGFTVGPPLCREALVSQAANVTFRSHFDFSIKKKHQKLFISENASFYLT